MARALRRIWEFDSGEEARRDETVSRCVRRDAGIMESFEECFVSSVSMSRDERPRCAVRALAAARREGGVR